MLRGFAGPSDDGLGKKIVALADLNVFRVGFGERTDVHNVVRVFQSFDIDPGNPCSKIVPLINLAFMVRCNLVTYLTSARTGLEGVTMELSTTGVELEVNPSLFSSYKLLELEMDVSLDKAKLAIARARFLLNELRGGIGLDKVKSPPLLRSSLAEPELKTKPRTRRMSLTSSMQSILRLTPQAPNSAVSHKRSTSVEPRTPVSPKSPKLQLFSRTVSINLVVKIGAGRCALFLCKDGTSFAHARRLYSFEFPQVMLR